MEQTRSGRSLRKLSLSHTHAGCFVSGEKRFGLTKTRNYKVFTYTELSRESRKVRDDSFFLVRAARTQPWQIQRKKGSGWTGLNKSLWGNEVKQNGWQSTAAKQLLGFQCKSAGSCEDRSDSLCWYWICKQQGPAEAHREAHRHHNVYEKHAMSLKLKSVHLKKQYTV